MQGLSKSANVDFSRYLSDHPTNEAATKVPEPSTKHNDTSFLAIEGLHAFVTGAAGGIGQAIVQELLGKFETVNKWIVRR